MTEAIVFIAMCEALDCSHKVFWGVLRLIEGLLIVAGFLLASVACLYAVRFVVLVITSFIPMIGERHLHDRWHKMNSAGRPPRDKSN
jgi:hypothetical protein